MEDNLPGCFSTDSWKTAYAAFKKKIVDTNLLLEKYNAATQDNSVLGKRVNDLTSLSQSLRSDCEKYEKDLQNAHREQEPLKQRCASLQADLECREREKVALEGTLASYKSTVRQYEDLLKQKQQEAEAVEKHGKGSNPKAKTDTKEKITSLEKKVHEGDKKLRQVEKKCKRALTIFKTLDEKLTKKGALTARERRQLKHVIVVLKSLSVECDEEKTGLSGDSSDDDNTARAKEDNDAEYLEKLLMNGNATVSSDTDDDLTTVPDADLVNKEVLVNGKDVQAPCKGSEVGKNCDKNGKEQEIACSSSQNCEEKSRNEASIQEQECLFSQSAEVPSSQIGDGSIPSCADAGKKGGSALEQVASDEAICPKSDLPCNDNISKAEDAGSTEEKAPLHPEGLSNESAEVELAGPRNLAPSAALNIQSSAAERGNGLLDDPTKPPSPLMISDVRAAVSNRAADGKNKSTSATKKHAEEAGKDHEAKANVETLKAELLKITSEMHFTGLRLAPLSPLPPSPPLFVSDPLATEEAASYHNNIPASSASTVSSEYHDAAPTHMSPDLTSASVKRRMRFTSKGKGKHRQESLPFTNMTENTSSDVAAGKRPFHHQQSEGFEPHLGNIELGEPQQMESSSYHDLSCFRQMERRKLYTKFWHNPADGTLNVKARLPRDSVKKQHLVPTITVEVDPVEYDFHLAYKEVPVALQEAQNTFHHDIEQDSERFTIPNESLRKAAVVSQSECSPPTQSMPVRPSSTEINVGNVRGAGHKRPAVVIPPVSFVCPTSAPVGEPNLVPVETLGGTTEPVKSVSAAGSAHSAVRKAVTAKTACTREVPKMPLHPVLKRKFGGKQLANKGQLSRAGDDRQKKNYQENVEKRKVSFGFNVSSDPPPAAGCEPAVVDSGQEYDFLASEKDQEYELPQRKKRRISLLSTKARDTTKFTGSKAPSKKAIADDGPQGVEDIPSCLPEGDTVTFSERKTSAVGESNASASVGGEPISTQKEPDSCPPTEDVARSDEIPTDPFPSDDDSDVVVPAKKRRVDCMQLPSKALASPSILSPLSSDGCDPHRPEAAKKASQQKEKRTKVPAAPYSIFVTTPKHNFMMARARGNITVNGTIKGAFDKLAWLANQTHVTPGAVRNVAHTLRSFTDMIAITALSYLANTTANPFLGYMRKEVSPPLLTPTEALMLECFEHVEEKRSITEGLFNILLTALRARLFSDRRPKTLLGVTAYCRMIAAICKRMDDVALLRVILWDVLRSFWGNTTFFIAAFVGVWPDVLATYSQSSTSDVAVLGLRYILFHAPHTLNSTLSAQTRLILQELGNMEPLDTFLTVSNVAEALIDALTTTASSEDGYLLCCLTLEEVCRRSADWQWVVSFVLKRLWQLMSKLMKAADSAMAGHLHCIIMLFGGIWRRFPSEENLSSLKPYINEVVTFLEDKEIGFAVQAAFVQSVLLLPFVEKWESLVSAIHSWQELHKADILQLKPVERILAKQRSKAKQRKKSQRRAAQPH